MTTLHYPFWWLALAALLLGGVSKLGADQVHAFAAILAPAAMLTAPTSVPEACQYIKQIIDTITLSDATHSGDTARQRVVHLGIAGISEDHKLGSNGSLPDIALHIIDSLGGSQAFSLPLLPEVVPYHHSKYMCFFETTHSIFFEADRGAVSAAPSSSSHTTHLDQK